MSELQSEPQSKGLKAEHFQELNGVLGNCHERCQELRERYSGNPLALWQIDRFDPESEFSRKIDEATEACQKKDQRKVNELEVWFKAHKAKYGLE